MNYQSNALLKETNLIPSPQAADVIWQNLLHINYSRDMRIVLYPHDADNFIVDGDFRTALNARIAKEIPAMNVQLVRIDTRHPYEVLGNCPGNQAAITPYLERRKESIKQEAAMAISESSFFPFKN